MPRSNPVRQSSFEEYLKLEEHSEVRHEFVDGYMFAMAGVTDHHNRLTNRINRLVFDAAEALGCEVFIADMLVKTPNDKGYYPDLFLTCKEVSDGSRFKRFPCWVVEVLSDSTESIDRGEKLHNYRTIPTLQAYILVSQDQRLVEVYRRLDDDTWRYETLDSTNPKPLGLPCIARDLSLEEIYKGL
jgi:Uma2 family endonuclease